MQYRARSLLLLFLPLAAVACGGTEPPDETTDDASLTFKTGPFDVAAGDVFECFYTDQHTDKELAVHNAIGKQGPGGHHIVAYWTDVEREPQHHPCEDSEMVNWHQIAGGDEVGSGEPTLVLPEGFAIQVPAGKQIVLQAHYINVTGETMTVDDSIQLETIEPEDVQEYVNYLVTLDELFEVPAQATTTSTSICTLDRDFNIVLMLPHMHEYGSQYKLEEIDETGAMTRVLLDEQKWSPEYASHPNAIKYTKEEPLFLPKGTRLRQSCTWINTTTDPLLFPREMCLSFSYYYPDEGELICDTIPEGAQ
jgi:hypothetical protein